MAKIRVEQEDFSSASGSDLNDEFDVEVFEDDNDSVSQESLAVQEVQDSDHDSEEVSSKKKQKKTFNPDALANAFQSVLRQNLSSVDGQDQDQESSVFQNQEVESVSVPILAKSKTMDDMEEEQIDYRARKILKAQIRSTQEAVHFPMANAPESLNFERSLRKLATRGVVQLFNAIQVSQQQKDDDKRVRRQEKLAAAQRSLPLVGNESALPLSTSSSSASYFDFLKQQQQKEL